MFTKFSEYRLLRRKNSSEEPFNDDEDNIAVHTRTRSSLRGAFSQLYIAALHVLLALAFVRLIQYRRNLASLETRILPSELQFAKDVIKYEDVTFDPSGFWEEESQHTPYEGAVSPETDEAWHSLTNVGMMSLTKDEYDALDLTTTPVPGESDRYLVTIEMFHQLHCLNYLRKRLYGTAEPELSEHGDAAHLDHCIDYLRQVLMCHGDLTPITLTWSQEMEWVKPNFSIRHTCRNFQSIWDFALTRNNTGLTIE